MNQLLKNVAKSLLRPLNLVLPAKVNGVRFRVPVMRGVGASNLDITEPWMIDALRRLLALAPGTAFMDVGVNLGQSLLKVKSLQRDIAYLGFEPNPFCVQYVNEMIRLNGLPNCEVLPVGLAERAELIAFVADSEADTAGSIIGNLRPDKQEVRRQHIAVFAFDGIARDVAPSRLALIKIDVEGAELETISGMTGFLSEKRPWVTCEVLHAHSTAQIAMLRERNGQLMRKLHETGYVVYRLLKDSQQSRVRGLEQVDAFSEGVWDPRTSPSLCDYLFAPREAREHTEQVFAQATQ